MNVNEIENFQEQYFKIAQQAEYIIKSIERIDAKYSDEKYHNIYTYDRFEFDEDYITVHSIFYTRYRYSKEESTEKEYALSFSNFAEPTSYLVNYEEGKKSAAEEKKYRKDAYDQAKKRAEYEHFLELQKKYNQTI